MNKIRNPEVKRKKIIEATIRILRDGGHYTNFSLDKVAKEAGVSKGGLMHHFPSKEALLYAVAQNASQQFEDSYNTKLSAEPAANLSRTIHAYIKTVLEDEDDTSVETSPILLAFIRAKTDDEAIETRFNYWQDIILDEGLDEVKAAIIRLAVDGLLYTELIDDTQIEPTLRAKILEGLLALAGESVVEEQNS